jgi:hypothetical protein
LGSRSDMTRGYGRRACEPTGGAGGRTLDAEFGWCAPGVMLVICCTEIEQ